MRNSHNITFTRSDAFMVDDDATSAFPGAVVGFVSWLLALGIPFLLYGPNTLFFFLYTWPFFLALMPVSVIIGIALHLLVKGKILFSIMFYSTGRRRAVWRVIYMAIRVDGLSVRLRS